VTIIASITDRSMNLGRQATPSTNLDGSPTMTEGLQLHLPAGDAHHYLIEVPVIARDCAPTPQFARDDRANFNTHRRTVS
jgi:hypothetical protein